MANDSGRDRYRDNDDMRDPLGPDEMIGTRHDTSSEARGDAREAVGNNARGTDTDVKGPEYNDNQRGRDDMPSPARRQNLRAPKR